MKLIIKVLKTICITIFTWFVIHSVYIIYDGLSERMIRLAENTKTYPNIHWSNRIHIDDLSCFLAHLLHVEHLKQSYIVTNNLPEHLHEKILKIQKGKGFPELVLESQNETGKRIFAMRMNETGFKLIQH